MIRDVQYWNSINPQHHPFDCEPERVLLNLATHAAELWDQGRHPEADAAMNAVIDYVVETFDDDGKELV